MDKASLGAFAARRAALKNPAPKKGLTEEIKEAVAVADARISESRSLRGQKAAATRAANKLAKKARRSQAMKKAWALRKARLAGEQLPVDVPENTTNVLVKDVEVAVSPTNQKFPTLAKKGQEQAKKKGAFRSVLKNGDRSVYVAEHKVSDIPVTEVDHLIGHLIGVVPEAQMVKIGTSGSLITISPDRPQWGRYRVVAETGQGLLLVEANNEYYLMHSEDGRIATKH